MHKRILKSSRSRHETRGEQHRFEHWYIDNQVYFITARCRGQFPAFASEETKAVFWRQFEKYTAEAGFVPWVTTLMDNHYHTVGYLGEGAKLKQMMQRLHGSAAKLVNDVLEAQFHAGKLVLPARYRGVMIPGAARPAEAGLAGVLDARGRLAQFWRDAKGKEYFDGALRDAKQCRHAYRYTYSQCQRAGICADARDYPHTRVRIELERGLKRALEKGALLEGIPYKRYEHKE